MNEKSKESIVDRGFNYITRRMEHWQVISVFLAFYDFAAIILSYFLALWFRFDLEISGIPENYFSYYLHSIIIYTLFCILIFMINRLYNSIWRFASYNELIRIIVSTIITSITYILIMTIFIARMPVSYYLFGVIFQFSFTLGIRFTYRFILLLRNHREDKNLPIARVMIIGAGQAGQMIFRDIKSAKEVSEKVYCFIDDNPNKAGRYIDGVPVVGGREHILEAVDKYGIEKIYVAIPSATSDDKREIINICSATDCKLMNLPGMYQLYTGQVSVTHMRQVEVEDLLGREPVQVNNEQIYKQLRDKVVLVTGGGGSIGSELCRQIAKNKPKKLIIFDVYENNAYEIQLELRDNYPELDLVVLIGSVRDSRRLYNIFQEYKPEIVYHAAAHKHVPLMESSPCEAIKNNAIGTYKTAYAAMIHGCKRFVLISTDKAVNPTNVMGASKRICEMICQSFDRKIKEGKATEIPQLFTHFSPEERHSDNIDADKFEEGLKNACTEFVAVRFGNVLGSNGSVIPIFKKQIEMGGPVTVTHPDIIRYFMTIPEAVGLVLQAGTYAKGGEIFVLDMGEPVKIATLARNLIRLSGYRPDIDIKVEYTGLRPGEKLYEEKLMDEEGMKKTDNDLIHIGSPVPFDMSIFLDKLESLMDAAYKNEEDIRDKIQDMVGTYHPDTN